MSQRKPHPSIAYTNLKSRFKNIGRLEAIAEIISRDFLTTMPEGAYEGRLDQISYLHRRIHDDIVSPEAQIHLEEAQEHMASHPNLWDEWDSANLKGMVKLYKTHAILDHDTMEESARIANEGRRIHRECLKNNDWEMAQAHLERVVKHVRKTAKKKAKFRNSATLYEALIQDYSPGVKLNELWSWFNHLNTELKKIMPLVIERQKSRKPIVSLAGGYSKEGQMWLNRSLLELLGFDYDRGGLYETGHSPVEGGTPDDTRLVIKNVDTKNFLDSMKSALHEGGHGLYIQGLPTKGGLSYQPVSFDLGTTMHESQALLVEMILGRTHEFFEFLAPRLEGLFHTVRDPSLTAGNLYRIKTQVQPSLDRKRADELTYFFHIFLRFQIECDLIEGKMEVSDIPAYWTEWMHDNLGVMPQNHMEGVMQDVHWFVGKFGYFQAYTLGHMVAAQLFDTLQQDIPDIFSRIRNGDFKPITKWLNRHIHSKGSIKPMDELLKDVTGFTPSPDFLISHIENRYLGE